MRLIPLPLLLLAGCLPAASTAPSQADDQTSAVPSETTIAMHRQLAQTEALRAAVVAADLDAAARASRTLARLPPITEATPEMGIWLARVKEAAGRVDDTWTLDTAALTVAEIGRTCGGCHQHLGTGPVFAGDGTPPASADGVPGHMRHHQAALDGMWQGLVTGEPLRFARAARALGQAGHADEAIVPQEQRLHDLAAAAAEARSPASRADAFAAVLAGCAGCHAARR